LFLASANMQASPRRSRAMDGLAPNRCARPTMARPRVGLHVVARAGSRDDHPDMKTVRERPLKVVVVGPARGGFTMCIHILHQFIRRLPDKRDLKQQVLDHAIRAVGDSFAVAMRQRLAAEGLAEELIFNQNFERLLGGPKWLAADDDTICVRKYVGVRSLGDFTLVMKLPRAVFDEDNVIHSHIQPRRWVEHAGLRDYRKFITLRNPVGILNSACFSINPITSEYIQRFMSDRLFDDRLRQDLAAFKLTHPDFLQGLIGFQKQYWSEALAVCDDYDHAMRWEDLIEHPIPTIRALGEACDLTIGDRWAERIWTEMSHRNLTGHHLHNYRQGAGVVGGWKSWLTNEHIDMIADSGLMQGLERFGYRIERLDESAYNPFQTKVAAAIRAGRVLDEVEDRALFGFAFNKSNLVSDKFSFRSYGWKTYTQLERSDFKDERIECAVWDAVEAAVGSMWEVFTAILAVDFHRPRTAQAGLLGLKRRFADLSAPSGGRLAAAFDKGIELTQRYFAKAPLDVEAA